MRKIFFPVLAILVVLSLSVVFSDCVLALGKTGAEEAINHNLLDKIEIAMVINLYFNALFSGQYNETKTYLYPGGPTDQAFDRKWNDLRNQAMEALGELEELDCRTPPKWYIEVTDVIISGNIAVAKLGDITVSTTCPSGFVHQTFSEHAGKEIVLCKYNGKWRILWVFPFLRFLK